MDIRPLAIGSLWWFLMVISECGTHTVTTATKSSSSGSVVNQHAEQPACERRSGTLRCDVPALDDNIDFRNYTGKISWLDLYCDKNRYLPSRLLDGLFAPLGQTLKYIHIYNCFIINISRQAFGGLERLQSLWIRSGSYPKMDNNWLERPTVSNSTQPSQTNLALPSTTWYHDNLVLPEGVFSELHNLVYLGLTAMRLNNSVWHAVKHLRNLNYLDLRDNNITIIDINTINNLQNLIWLDLNDNHIQVIPNGTFESLSLLWYLDLSGNKIRLIEGEAFKGLSELETLLLSGNSIRTIDRAIFQGLSKLYRLDLSDNSIMIINKGIFSGLSQLGTLDLSQNNISRVGTGIFKGLSYMHTLNLTVNKISIVEKDTFNGLSNLKNLYLAENRLRILSHLTLSHLTSLRTLDLSYNLIETIPKFPRSLTSLNLRNNSILGVDKSSFAGLQRLTHLDLSYNKISEFTQLNLSVNNISKAEMDTVKGLSNLNQLYIPDNRVIILSHLTLSRLTSLRTLDLSYNLIETIPKFPRSLTSLNLRNNSILGVDKSSFAGLQQLTHLDLSYNKISEFTLLNLSVNNISKVEMTTVKGLSNLNQLYIPANRVRILAHLTLSRLPSLRTLDLSYNLIETIPKFPRSLILLNLRNNRILGVDNSSFAGLQQLTHLDLSYNKISEYTQYHIPYTINEWNVSSNELSVASLNLTAKLVFADFKNNKLKTLTIYGLTDNRYAEGSGHIYLAGNGDPFRCTCNIEMSNNESTFIYDKSTVAQYQSWNFTSLNCMSVSDDTRESKITEISTRKFVCNTTCYGNCTCYYWKYGGDNVNIVDCLGAGLTAVPINISVSCTILDLSGNMFPSLGPDNFQSLPQLVELYLNASNITEIKKGTFRELSYLRKIDLSNNGISILNSGIFRGLSRLLSLDLSFNSLRVVVESSFKYFDRLNNLDLAENELKNISISDIESMHGIQSLQLSKNPWSCDCEFLETFKPFTSKNSKHIKDYTEIKCFDSNKTEHYLFQIDLEMFCPDSEQKDAKSKAEIVLGSIFGVFVLSTFCFFILIKNREFFKLWFFIKFGWKSASAETEDWNRPYDAFVSYSNADEAFVTRELMPRLEEPRQGRLGYKLCVHFRDFPVGGHIPETILGAVNDSRRVIMILSDNFLSSEWCNYEFQAAHHRLLTEWQNRIIMILLHDLNRYLLDRQLKLYLSTRTYVKVGDPLLWDKIEYAMPERKSPTEDNLNADNNDDQVDNIPAGGDEDTDEDVQLIN